MEPDGYLLIITCSTGPDAELVPFTTEKVLFSEIKGWSTESYGLTIEAGGRRRIIPWCNIVELHIVENSDKYREWCQTQPAGTVHEGV